MNGARTGTLASHAAVHRQAGQSHRRDLHRRAKWLENTCIHRPQTAPRGFDKEHVAIDLLRHKNFYAFKKFKDAEVTDPNFLKEVIKTHKAIRPWFDYMSEVLTTDLNGIPLY